VISGTLCVTHVPHVAIQNLISILKIFFFVLFFIFFKVLDVERMLAKSSMDLTAKGMEQGHPVIRTLYDHMEVSPVHLNFEMAFIKSCKLWGNVLIPKISFRNDE
jgi:hypothetical protein